MHLYGLTGGTGSGKSTAAKRFAARDLPVIDADATGHTVLAPGGSVEAEVKEAFGAGILTDGIIDRDKLAARVFQDDRALERLNSIVHPAIFVAIAKECERLAETGEAAALLDAALLGEHDRRDPFLSGLIVITAPAAQRMERLTQQRGMARDDVARRMKVQGDPDRKCAFADWVIDNSGTLEDLHRQVDAIVEAIHDQLVRK
ncbi:MAG: dephospho-CoA kinase [Candidatus Hydrogenedentes bacterium]|nr:dephospho-CoA kinase [Candidatus Hydrogenedentota bacterium]